MYQTNNDDLSIYVTRGDIVALTVTAGAEGKSYTFKPGDVLRIKVFSKKNVENVVLQKDFPVLEYTESVEIYLTGEDTKIGDEISKPVDYWYEVELNPLTTPQTIIGYDEDGPKIFKLFPEGADIDAPEDTEGEPNTEGADSELDINSYNPIQNRVVAANVARLEGEITAHGKRIIAIENIHNSEGFIEKLVDVCKTYTDNFDKLVYGNAYTAYDATTKQVDGKWQLDCSSFQNLLIRGVTFENSRYAGNEKNIENPLFFTKFNGYEFRLANTMAKWLYDNGYTFKPNKDYSNIEPGDLVFYSWPDKISGEFHDNAFMNIDHVAMFLQKKNDSAYQTIQYERNTPSFFYDVDEEYMKGTVLVARLPFPLVDSGDNIVIDSDKAASLTNASTYIVGEYHLAKPMEAGKMYTCCFKGKVATEGAYFILKSSDNVTLFSNYGETWDGKEKEYKFSFVCPTGLTQSKTICISCSAGNGTTRTATVKNFYLFEGYKRVCTDCALPASYPIYKDFVFADAIKNDLNNSMAPSGYVLEFKDYYLVALNVPLNTLRTGNVLLGSLGAKVSATRRAAANLVGVVNGVTTHYNGFLQVSSGSNTGDVYVNTWNSSQQYQYIMANAIIAK